MNEQEMRLLQESFYVEEMTLQTIFELIDEQQSGVESYKILMESAQSDTLSISAIPEISITELGWSDMSTPEDSKEFSSTARGQLMNFLKNIQGGDLADKLDSLQQFYDMDQGLIEKLNLSEKASNDKVSAVLSYLVFYKTLTQIVSNFNASSAGFSFESFLAVLLGGKQEPANSGTIADLTTADGTPISLKLYKEDTVEVGGSYRDLVKDLISGPGYMQYVVCAKNLSAPPDRPTEQQGTIKFYRFNFTLDNIFNILSTSSKKSRRNIILPASFIKDGTDVRSQLSQGGEYPSPKEAEMEFQASAKKRLQDDDIDKAIGSIDYNDLFTKLNYSKDDTIFSGGKPKMTPEGEPIDSAPIQRGAAQLQLTAVLRRLEKVFPDADRKARRAVFDRLNLANQELVAKYSLTTAQLVRKKEITSAYLQGTDADLIERSVTAYNRLPEEQKKQALAQTLGFNGSKAQDVGHFNMTGRMVLGLSDASGANTIPAGNKKGVEIGELTIGTDALQKMLNQVIAIINTSIFDIFGNLKLLTLNIKTYFAGGLSEDSRAATAIGAAENIGSKTKEVSGVTGGETAGAGAGLLSENPSLKDKN